MPPLEIEDVPLDGAPGVVVRGEVDLATVVSLTEALDAAIRDSVGAFVLDLCDVTFLDSSGIGAVMRARALLGREDRSLTVICPPGPVRRVFAIAGVADLLALYDSRAAAAEALVPAD